MDYSQLLPGSRKKRSSWKSGSLRIVGFALFCAVSVPATAHDFIVVGKSDLRAELHSINSADQKITLTKAYTIAIGKELGDKMNRGDNKTPEGIYLTIDILQGKTLPEKYGPFAITLNYPNHFDRFEKKTGSGIWLHGVIADERVEKANVTEGCVAFYNGDITELSSKIPVGKGIIIIANHLNEINQADVRAAVHARFEGWYSAWKNRDQAKYAEFYHSQFQHGTQSVADYVVYKKNVFATYKNMRVDLSNSMTFTHPKYAVTVFNQDFDGDGRYVSSGRKLIYWQQDAGVWKIFREVFENQRFSE